MRRGARVVFAVVIGLICASLGLEMAVFAWVAISGAHSLFAILISIVACGLPVLVAGEILRTCFTIAKASQLFCAPLPANDYLLGAIPVRQGAGTLYIRCSRPLSDASITIRSEDTAMQKSLPVPVWNINILRSGNTDATGGNKVPARSSRQCSAAFELPYGANHNGVLQLYFTGDRDVDSRWAQPDSAIDEEVEIEVWRHSRYPWKVALDMLGE